MKTFRENETIIWLFTGILLMIGYWFTLEKTDMFLILGVTSLLMSRISKLQDEINKQKP
jgi:hypothetical protein